MNLKIGILGSRGIPNAYGGFEQFAQGLAERLVLKGHEVYVYNSSLHPYQEKTWKGVRIIHCKDWEDKLGAAGQFFYDRNCINDARKRNYHILLQLGYTSNSIWHRRWPKNTVNIVNMDGLEWKRTQYSVPVRRFIRKAEAWAANYGDHLVADSPGIQQYLLNTYDKPSTFIPYAADIFSSTDVSLLDTFQLKPYQYYLSVSRLEPENNVEMVIKGYLQSAKDLPLIIVGGINHFGKQWMKKYAGEKIRFVGSVYDKPVLNNLRYFSKLHFHAHSVGGTNPSLLEAMGCHTNLAAHDNIFNRAILGKDAEYFSNPEQLAEVLVREHYLTVSNSRQEENIRKIETIYNWEKITDAYEALMIETFNSRQGAGKKSAHQTL